MANLKATLTALKEKNERRKVANGTMYTRSVNRSTGGDVGIYIMLTIVGIVMALPMLYAVCQSLKPLD